MTFAVIGVEREMVSNDRSAGFCVIPVMFMDGVVFTTI